MSNCKSVFVDYIRPSHKSADGHVSSWNAFGNPNIAASDGPSDYFHLQPIEPVFQQVQQEVMFPQRQPSIQQFHEFSKTHLSSGGPSRPVWENVGRALPYFGASHSLEGVMAWASMYLLWMSALKQRGVGAIILDIDDTVLTRSSATHATYMSVCIEPVKQLYQYALSLGVSVYFVTARPHTPENLRHTLLELKRLGMDKFHSLFLMPDAYVRLMSDPASPLYQDYSRYKYEARRFVHEVDKRDILLTVGDMWADMLLAHQHLDYDHVSSRHETQQHREVCKFLENGMPEDMHYILKLPDVAMMAIKLIPKHIRNEK